MELKQEAINYKEKLNEIYSDFKKNDNDIDESLIQRLKELLKYTEQDIDTDDYMKMMYMQGSKYQKQKNVNAARYCAMRMLDIKECYVNKKKKRPRFLDIIDYDFSDEMNEFINHYTDFLYDVYRQIERKLIMIAVVIGIVVFGIFTFLLKINPIISLLNAIIIGVLNYVLQRKKLPEIFKTNQLNAIQSYVEEDVLEFDRPIRYS